MDEDPHQYLVENYTIQIPPSSSNLSIASSIIEFDAVPELERLNFTRRSIFEEVNKELNITHSPLKYDVDFEESEKTVDSTQISVDTVNKSNSMPESPQPLYYPVCFSIILENAIEELKLVGLLDNYPDLKIEPEIGYRSIADRLSNLDENNRQKSLEESILKQKLSKADKARQKFHQERVSLEDILKEAVMGLLVDGNCFNLMKRLSDIAQMKKDEQNMLNKVKYYKKVLPLLQAIIEKEDVHFKYKIQNKVEIIGRLKDTLEDARILAAMKDRYIQRWENSRNEQSRLKLEKREISLRNTIAKNETEMEREYRVHSEIIMFLNISMQEYLEEIEYWKHKLEEEKETRDRDLEILKTKREILLGQYTEHKAFYDKRQKEINDYLEYKEEKKRNEAVMKKLNAAASKIQAWWRGIMVRKGLGPYRKKKPKGKKKGADKKNGGKKAGKKK